MFRLATLSLELALAISGYLFAAEMPMGSIISAGKGRITIMQQQNKEVSYEVAQNAMVLLDNKPSSLDKLTIGDLATLTLETRNAKDVVTTVDAKSAKMKTESEVEPAVTE